MTNKLFAAGLAIVGLAVLGGVSVHADETPALEQQRSAAIKLEHVSAKSLMMAFELYSTDDILNERSDPWKRDAGRTYTGNTTLVPKGISEAWPYRDETILAVRGTASAIDEFRSIIAKVDLEPKWVGLHVDSRSVDRKSLAEKGLDRFSMCGKDLDGLLCAGSLPNSLLDELDKPTPGASGGTCGPNNNCIVQHFTITNGTAPLAGYDYAIIPRVNTDGTITLLMKWKVWDNQDPKNPRSSETKVQRRVADGQNFAVVFPEWWAKGAESTHRTTLMVFTPTVIEKPASLD